MKLTRGQWIMILFLSWLFLIIPFEMIGYLTSEKVHRILQTIWITPIIVIGFGLIISFIKSIWNEI